MFGKVIAKLEEQADLKPVYIYTFTIFALKTTFVGRRIRQTKKPLYIDEDRRIEIFF
jgi:hypothetical protein